MYQNNFPPGTFFLICSRIEHRANSINITVKSHYTQSNSLKHYSQQIHEVMAVKVPLQNTWLFQNLKKKPTSFFAHFFLSRQRNMSSTTHTTWELVQNSPATENARVRGLYHFWRSLHVDLSCQFGPLCTEINRVKHLMQPSVHPDMCMQRAPEVV